MEPEGSFPCLQQPATGPYPEPDDVFHSIQILTHLTGNPPDGIF